MTVHSRPSSVAQRRARWTLAPERLGAALQRGLDLDYPLSLEREQALLAEGRRDEALARLTQAREKTAAAARRTPVAYLVGGGDPPSLGVLEQVAVLAREQAASRGWSTWNGDAGAFEALATAAEREVREIRAELAAKLESARAREQRRRRWKAIALCVLAPLMTTLVVGAAPEPIGASRWALGVAVAGVLGLAGAVGIAVLWKRGLRGDLLYVPAWAIYFGGGLAGALAALA